MLLCSWSDARNHEQPEKNSRASANSSSCSALVRTGRPWEGVPMVNSSVASNASRALGAYIWLHRPREPQSLGTACPSSSHRTRSSGSSAHSRSTDCDCELSAGPQAGSSVVSAQARAKAASSISPARRRTTRVNASRLVLTIPGDASPSSRRRLARKRRSIASGQTSSSPFPGPSGASSTFSRLVLRSDG